MDDEQIDPNYVPSSECYESDAENEGDPVETGDLGSTVAKNWHGKVIDSKEYALAIEWNEKAATGAFDKYNYRKYRKEMTAFGLPGKNWHVGHIAPNEKGTGRDKGPEDLGWNLMALDA